MDSQRRSSVIWLFASIGGALPLPLTLTHLMQRSAFDTTDIILWPACALLLRNPMATPPGLLMVAAAALLNILWYSLLGWLICWVIERLAR